MATLLTLLVRPLVQIHQADTGITIAVKENENQFPSVNWTSMWLGIYTHDYCMIACNLRGQVSRHNTAHERLLSLTFKILVPYAIHHMCSALNNTLV